MVYVIHHFLLVTIILFLSLFFNLIKQIRNIKNLISKSDFSFLFSDQKPILTSWKHPFRRNPFHCPWVGKWNGFYYFMSEIFPMVFCRYYYIKCNKSTYFCLTTNNPIIKRQNENQQTHNTRGLNNVRIKFTELRSRDFQWQYTHLICFKMKEHTWFSF